ncbi:MAG: hypothetical protein JW873_04460 [Candidatus Saganbacteria bacterium]|nr:hypothetical protein [Candidatus Saganbacteria bacterium]
MWIKKTLAVLVILLVLQPFCFAADYGNRIGLGTKLGCPISHDYFLHLAGYDLTYTINNNYWIETYISSWSIPPWDPVGVSQEDLNIMIFSLYLGKITDQREDARTYFGCGIGGSYNQNTKMLKLISPVVKLGGELGFYRGINFVLETGYPLILSAGIKWYL